MQLTHHKNLNPEIWSKYSKDRQILMIANELNRLINGLKADFKIQELKSCIERILELADLTIICQNKSLRKELLRWREIFGENYIISENELRQQLKNLNIFLKTLLLMSKESSILI